MKKVLKTACLTLSLLLICLTLCSCNALDDAKKSQAFFVGDDIVFQGEVYKKLPTLDEGCTLNMQNTKVGYLTEEGVPVLLSSFVGTSFIYSSNGMLNATIPDEYGYIHRNYYYCREDMYDELSELIYNNEFVHYCAEYYDYDNDDYSYHTKYQLIDDDLTEIFNEALQTGHYATLNGYDFNNYYYNYNLRNYDISIYLCDANMILRGTRFDIVYSDFLDAYQLIDDQNVYSIPAEYNEQISAFVQKFSDVTDIM